MKRILILIVGATLLDGILAGGDDDVPTPRERCQIMEQIVTGCLRRSRKLQVAVAIALDGLAHTGQVLWCEISLT